MHDLHGTLKNNLIINFVSNNLFKTEAENRTKSSMRRQVKSSIHGRPFFLLTQTVTLPFALFCETRHYSLGAC